MPAIEELSRAVCLDRLASVDLGHIAVSYKALPVVVPVRIVAGSSSVVVASLLGARIPLHPGCVVALEASSMGDGSREEWMVEVTGLLRAADPSQAGDDEEYFSISTDLIVGWRRMPAPIAVR